MTSTLALPDLSVGTWTIDPTHSSVSFSVRHLMVSKVRGSFHTFSGTIEVPAEGTPTVSAEIAVDSFDTGNAQRDGHVRSADFMEVDKYPTITFRSTGVQGSGSEFTLVGDLTIHGVTKSVELAVEFNGVSPGMGNGPVAGFEASTEISRSAFGIDMEMPLEGGGVVLGDKVKITIEIEAGPQA
ncbi:YceI family protein [Rhodococcus sp. X156]|uniref:YceI family protein n=1 Tax=Rhodococcus sp. X156 TaxID=2499145 RepID=UPI000FDC8D8B|nr:YceI family protein [Rhodococcus sp. X156]